MDRFGKVLYDLRKKKGLTQEAVGFKVGMGKGYISLIENGRVNPPSPRLLKKYAMLYGVPYRELLVRAHLEKAPKEIREEMMGLFEVWRKRSKK